MIMLVDDDIEILNLIKEILSEYTCKLFQDPRIALDEFLKKMEEYNLIITDFTMPFLNGIQLTKKIRQFNVSVPILILSGDAQKIEMDEGFKELKSQKTQLLAKPFKMNYLKNIVASLVL